MKTRLLSLALLWVALASEVGIAAPIELVDISGQKVVLQKPAQRIVLGEGRFLAALGALGIERPLQRVVGMMNEFALYDPTSFSQYQKAYPAIDNIARFGHTNEASVSTEKLLALAPDLAIFGLAGHGPGARSKHIIERLQAAGIPVLFIDFRQQPVRNTAASMELIAKALGEAEKGRAFAEFYRRELAKVTGPLADLKPEQYPKVLFELRAGSAQECCLSVARGMFAAMAEVAGGRSVAEGILPGPVGQLGMEKVLSSEFDVYIGTAIGGPGAGEFLQAGPGVGAAAAGASVAALMQRRSMHQLAAIEAGRAYALWHHFYNSPLNIYAIQTMAKWFHPERFAALEPEQTLNKLLAGFAPVQLGGAYSAAITAAGE